jgi:hypothetical protein
MQSIIPGWFFQGIEKMKYFAVATIAAKFFFAITIVLLIEKPEDYIFGAKVEHNIELKDNAFHYVVNVMRCKARESLEVFNGNSSSFLASLSIPLFLPLLLQTGMRE